MSNTKTARAILMEAKDRIGSPESWLKGDFHAVIDGRDCYCSLGSILACRESRTCGAADILSESLPAAFDDQPGSYRSIARFNDNPDTTHADVMAAFDRAIAAA